MADKSVGELIAATSVTPTDLLVLEQNGTAKKLTGQILENWLVSFADGHGGIQSIKKIGTDFLADTYRITLSDTTTFDFVVTNGRSINSIVKTSTSGLIDTYTITYNDGDKGTFTVTNGEKGDKGDNQYVWIKYASQKPTEDSHSFGDEPDNWIGVYSGSAETAPDDWTEYEWFEIKGKNGDTGEPATLNSSEVEYQVADSGSIIPSGAWSASVPVVGQGKYLWTRITNIFNTGNPVISYSVSRMGLDGSGSVSSVANVSPDSNGNVPLTAEDIGALPYTGGDLTGELKMNGQPISGLSAPTQNDHAANKGFVDHVAEKRLNLDYITDDAHIVPSGADLNNFTTPGVYRIPTSAIMDGLKNTPGYTSAGAKLIVCATSATNTGVAHFMIFNSKMNRIFYRVMASDTGWGEWVEMASKEDIYPVGAIYMSVNSTSPASLFGGTWTQLKDRFLLGAGSTYSNGATGGAAAVTLTLSQIPSHTHDLNVASADNTGSASTSQVVYGKPSGTNYTNDNAMESAGGGTSHSNMPPYLVVYMWKRTA